VQSKQNTLKLIDILQNKYGKVTSFLTHQNVFEFLIAVILSAQTTDIMVNKVTPDLFAKYPTPNDLKQAKLKDVESLIRRVNYHHNKSKYLIETARIIDEEFKGNIPTTIQELIKFPGVGRKVANVIVSDFHGIPEGFVVDTHIKRVTYRIGWTKHTDPKRIELDLMTQLPKESWVTSPKQLILIGREYCFPKNPNCKDCPLNEICEKNMKVINS
jgi:endonuclease-3